MNRTGIELKPFVYEPIVEDWKDVLFPLTGLFIDLSYAEEAAIVWFTVAVP